MKNNERAEIIRIREHIERIAVGDDIKEDLKEKWAELERAVQLQVRFRRENNLFRGGLIFLTMVTTLTGIVTFFYPLSSQMQSGLIAIIGVLSAALLAFETFYQSGMRYLLYRKSVTLLKFEFHDFLDLINKYEKYSTYNDAYKIFKAYFWQSMKELEKELSSIHASRIGSVTKLAEKDETAS